MKLKIFLFIFIVITVTAAMVGPIMSNVEQPKYTVTQTQGAIEVREYAPMVIAVTTVEAPRKEAINEGFRTVADYIFGNNTKTQEIAMTAPVQQQESQKIAMTAPAQQQGTDDGSWQVSFVMPSEYTLENLPKPSNNQVKLNQVPAQKFIVIKFSGKNTTQNIQKYEAQLLEYVAQNNLKVTGQPKYAFYNPPWTLPFLRRNEVMLQLAE